MPPYIQVLYLLLGGTSLISCNLPVPNSNLSQQLDNCPPFVDIRNGNAVLKMHQGKLGVSITCDTNYTLIGSNFVEADCLDGYWQLHFDGKISKCEQRCSPPPYLEHGKLDLKKELCDLYTYPSGSYLEGTVATYTCQEGYVLEPPASSVRVCKQGAWTGSDLFCKPIWKISCPMPPMFDNGYMHPSFSDISLISVGQEIIYQCLYGYKLVGLGKIRCSSNGEWLPEIPICQRETDFIATSPCASRPLLDPKIHPNVEIKSVGETVAEIGCQRNFRNILAPCKSSKFYCSYGKWIGVYPKCVETYTCKAPPAIPYALAFNRNFQTSYDSEGFPFYPINAQISYECLKGYVMKGNPVITCKSGGCWESRELWPSCIRNKEIPPLYFRELDNLETVLVSVSTGFGVLAVLLLACVVVARKKRRLRRALARAVSPPPSSPDVVNDHAVLLQHPDRLALIAFAEGVQNSQSNSLPSYDEATRDSRSTLIQVSRLQIQRPHWPNLTVCRTSGRSRNSPNIDPVHHVTRHGSFVSHTPSMRSGGESMGSTETVTISEGSTNITLDTASSHSAVSQNPSCRGHCGSLASFDACSIANNDGIPLLEENELEEAQCSANETDLPNSDSSCMNSTHSAPMLAN